MVDTVISPATRTARIPARAEHIGSLLRPAGLKAHIATVYEPTHTGVLADERARDLEALREAEDEYIRDVVRRQIAAGLDVITDGEFRRVHFCGSFYDAVEGIRASSAESSDGIVFYDDHGEPLRYSGSPVIHERLRKIDDTTAREASFVAAQTNLPVKVTLPAASRYCDPREFVPARAAYRDHDELIDHAISITHELADEAIKAGATYIQFDYPTYVYLLDEQWAPSVGLTPDEVLDMSMKADRAVIDGLPDHVRVGLHLCRGNYRSRWMFKGSVEPFAERVFNELPYDTFLVEWDDPKRQGDFTALRHVPSGPTVVLGLISSKHSEVESEDAVMRRMEEAGQYLDMEQLAISPQCGFSSEAKEGNELDEDAQWRKLELVGRIADRIWPRS